MYLLEGNPARLIETYYAYPNPSTTVYPGAPNGHWHVEYDYSGTQTFCQYSPNNLEEDHTYLKGGVTSPNGGLEGLRQG